MNVNELDIDELAVQFLRFVERGEFEQFDQYFSESVTIWHNFDNETKRWSDVRVSLAAARAKYSSMHYDEIRVSKTPTGWVQQHVIHIVEVDGTPREVFAAMIYTVGEDGLICRMEEYLDRLQLGSPAQQTP